MMLPQDPLAQTRHVLTPCLTAKGFIGKGISTVLDRCTRSSHKGSAESRSR